MRFLVVDDHPLFRTAMRMLLEQFDGEAVVEEEGTIEAAAARLKEENEYDLVLMDIGFGSIDALDDISDLLHVHAETPFVMISNYEDSYRISRSLEQGARGYIPKSTPSATVKGALQLVLSGGTYAPTNLLNTMLLRRSTRSATAAEPDQQLNDYQFGVLKELAKGKSNQSIGDTLDMSLGTVKLHIQSILQVLEAKNRTEAVVKAIKGGLI